jgi:hypothetical protein
MNSTRTDAARHALVIGIDDYPYISKLQGCVNDALLMRRILEQKFGFSPDNITQLLNEQATREAILRELDALVARVGEDDIVVIQYAGHGSQMTDREGDEPDGLDETIMPYDTEGWRGDNRDISDDEIHLRLLRLSRKTSYTTLIVDACHSGTITRDGFGMRARAMPPDLRPVDQLPPSPITPEMQAEMQRSAGTRGPSGWLPMEDHYVLLAGCRDEEISYEYQVNEGKQPVVHGAMTYFLSEELIRAMPGTTYRDVFERVAAKVNANNGRQHPQMEGRIDREIFGIRDVQPMKFVKVEAREGDVVTLSAGAAHGVTVGSTYTVYPQTSKETRDQDALGTVQITDVGAFESEAQIGDPATVEAIVAGSRAVETEHAWGSFRLGVEVVDRTGGETSVESLVRQLEGCPLLELKEREASLRVYALGPRDRATPEDPVPQLGAIDAPTLAVVDQSGGLLMPPKTLDQAEDVRDNLEKLARYRQLLHLDNPDPGNTLRGRIRFELLRKDSTGGWIVAEPEEAGGHVVYEEGEAIAFRVSSSHDEPLFVTIFDFGLAGQVAQVFPRRHASQKLGAGLSFDVWTQGKPRRVTLKEVGPHVDQGVEAVKLIASETEVELSGLEQEGFRAGPTSAHGLARLFGAAASGGDTRGIEEPVEDDWISLTRAFVVRRRRTGGLSAGGSSLNVGNVSLSASDIQGQVTVEAHDSPHVQASAPTPESLLGAMRMAEMRSTQAVLLEEVSAGRSGEVTLRVPAPPPGHGQVVLAADDVGVLSWHLPELAAEGPSGRGDAFTYHIPCGEEGRGLPAKLTVGTLKVMVFPRVDPLLEIAGQAVAAWWEPKVRPYRVRTFLPDDFDRPEATAIGPEDWKALSAGRALLMVHGTNSQAHLAFGGLGRSFVEDLHRRYAGRVFAFDHPTLSHDPVQNVQWLIDQVPEGMSLDLDLICHSRGGLVARVLTEAQESLELGTRRINVGTVVFVGSPNAGTPMAVGREMGRFFDTYTNLLCRLPSLTGLDALAVVLESIKHVASMGMGGLRGLRSMEPGGSFAQRLAQGSADPGVRYFAVASDFQPKDRVLARLMATQLKGLFDGPHDFVVPVASVYGENGSPLFPVSERLVLSGDEAMSHVEYFGSPRVRNAISKALSGATTTA